MLNTSKKKSGTCLIQDAGTGAQGGTATGDQRNSPMPFREEEAATSQCDPSI